MRRLLLCSAIAAAPCWGGCDESGAPPPPPGQDTAAESSPAEPASRHGLAAVDTSRGSGRSSREVVISPPTDPAEIGFLGLKAPTDPTWRWEPPKNAMRVANWIVPAPEGAEPAELVIMSFPEAAGNTREANIARWTSQFRADDLPPQPEVTELEGVAFPTTLVELRGEYLGMGGGWHKANYVMLVAMIASPDGSVFIKLLGDAATVDGSREALMRMLEGLHAEE